MANFFFYAATVLIWGSTWLAIKFQLGVVPPVLSIAYRFALAALMLVLWCAITRRSLRFSASEHFYLALQGLLLFALNYLFFYLAGTGFQNTGLVQPGLGNLTLIYPQGLSNSNPFYFPREHGGGSLGNFLGI